MRVHSRMVVLLALASLTLAGCGGYSAPSTVAASADHGASHEGSPAAAPSVSSTEPSASDAAVAEEPPADATRLEDGAEIVIADHAYGETVVVVPAGATLTFTNEDAVAHTVTEMGDNGFPAADPTFDLGVVPGASRDLTFDEPGRFGVICKPHPTMKLTVFVEG